MVKGTLAVLALSTAAITCSPETPTEVKPQLRSRPATETQNSRSPSTGGGVGSGTGSGSGAGAGGRFHLGIVSLPRASIGVDPNNVSASPRGLDDLTGDFRNVQLLPNLAHEHVYDLQFWLVHTTIDMVVDVFLGLDGSWMHTHLRQDVIFPPG